VVSIAIARVDEPDQVGSLVGACLPDDAALGEIVGPAATTRLRDEGVCVLHDLWSEGLCRALADEAADVAVRHNRREGYSILAGGDLLGPFSYGTGTGPLLAALHANERIVSALRGLSGRLLVPTSSAYLFYGGEDFAGLHSDLTKCELVLLATVSGNLRPLMLHPDQAGSSARDLELLGLETGGAPSGGAALPSAVSGATALRGTEIPHHRPACRLEERGVVVTLCYRAAF
jgi:hypothetical protein